VSIERTTPSSVTPEAAVLQYPLDLPHGKIAHESPGYGATSLRSAIRSVPATHQGGTGKPKRCNTRILDKRRKNSDSETAII
jgi:hypothetical protein